MATSNGGGGSGNRFWAYLTSTRFSVAGGAGVATGATAYVLQAPPAMWLLIAAGSYVATVTLWRKPPPDGPVEPVNPANPVEPVGRLGGEEVPPVLPPRLWPQLEELASFVGSAPLPASANVPGLLVRLRTAGPGPTTEPIVQRRLPLAVDGYLRALTWQPWVPDGADPAAELARAVDEMAALVPAS
ncbi:hypothetical protein [Kitasatospora sp. NPDC008115]|uniref:hypothetical protein n=1 Tax=Kitasatospora sp. NPDC008115 TaxID=3364022 RepID=UPI0036EDCD4B